MLKAPRKQIPPPLRFEPDRTLAKTPAQATGALFPDLAQFRIILTLFWAFGGSKSSKGAGFQGFYRHIGATLVYAVA